MVPLSESWKQSLEQAARTFEENLETAIPYLTERGIDLETARDFRFGFVEGGRITGDGPFRGRLSIPYIGGNDIVQYIVFRALNDERPKYTGYSLSRPLFNLRVVTDPALDEICITEGELDAVVLSMAGHSAVAVPGANAWKPHHRRIFEGYSRVVVFADGDEPGKQLAKKISKDLPNAVIAQCPEDEDVNSMYLTGGKEALESLVP